MTAALQLMAANAAQAYDRAASGRAGEGTSGFGAMVAQALDGAIATGHQADANAMAVAGGAGNITDVVAAVSKAELTLQTTAAIRDRVVQAYQDIMRMPI